MNKLEIIQNALDKNNDVEVVEFIEEKNLTEPKHGFSHKVQLWVILSKKLREDDRRKLCDELIPIECDRIRSYYLANITSTTFILEFSEVIGSIHSKTVLSEGNELLAAGEELEGSKDALRNIEVILFPNADAVQKAKSEISMQQAWLRAIT